MTGFRPFFAFIEAGVALSARPSRERCQWWSRSFCASPVPDDCFRTSFKRLVRASVFARSSHDGTFGVSSRPNRYAPHSARRRRWWARLAATRLRPARLGGSESGRFQPGMEGPMAEPGIRAQQEDSMNAESLIEMQRRVTHEHMTSETEKRWSDTYSTFSQTEHAALDAMGIGARFAGIEAVKGFYEVFHAAFPDFTVTTLREYDMPGTSIREVMIRGTHKGEYCGLSRDRPACRDSTDRPLLVRQRGECRPDHGGTRILGQQFGAQPTAWRE